MESHFTSTQYLELAGKLERVSDWVKIDQTKIDLFAQATDDHQFIHIDPRRTALETPFEGTIAHGFLSLSMLSSMISSSFPTIENTAMSINYGFEKVRFLNTVSSGSRIRGHFKLSECKQRKPDEILSLYDVSVEIENIEKPALVAQWLGLTILNS